MGAGVGADCRDGEVCCELGREVGFDKAAARGDVGTGRERRGGHRQDCERCGVQGNLCGDKRHWTQNSLFLAMDFLKVEEDARLPELEKAIGYYEELLGMRIEEGDDATVNFTLTHLVPHNPEMSASFGLRVQEGGYQGEYLTYSLQPSI